MKEGDVILASVPQADGQIKNRAAVLLREMPGYGDLLVCGISRQVHQIDRVGVPLDCGPRTGQEHANRFDFSAR